MARNRQVLADSGSHVQDRSHVAGSQMATVRFRIARIPPYLGRGMSLTQFPRDCPKVSELETPVFE